MVIEQIVGINIWESSAGKKYPKSEPKYSEQIVAV